MKGMTLSQDALLALFELKKPTPPSWEAFAAASASFEAEICHRPTQPNWIDGETTTPELRKCVSQSYPLLHEKVLPLIDDFAKLKKKMRESEEERRVYHDAFTLVDLIDRLIRKRPVMFMAKNDKYLLRNGVRAAGFWDLVGTDRESAGNAAKRRRREEGVAPASLDDYMSYDEIKLSALLQVSSPVLPINAGSRKNSAVVSGGHIKEAIYVGAVGARLTRPRFMECQEMVITKKNSVPENGYGMEGAPRDTVLEPFAKFYGCNFFPSYEDCSKGKMKDGIFSEKGEFFNYEVYIKRIQVTAETSLLEAQERGSSQGKDVHVHVVGLGLGVWARWRSKQAKYFLMGFRRALENLGGGKISAIKRIDFSWIPEDFDPKPDGGFGNLSVTFSKRDPFAMLDDAENRLVVAMYAWDGNSLPGNEYWIGMLSSTGDPAAACCTQIAQVQNPCINSRLISVENLHVASLDHGVLHASDYAKLHLNTD